MSILGHFPNRHFLTRWAALGCAAVFGLSCEKAKQEAAPAATSSAPSQRPALLVRCTPAGSTIGLTIGEPGSDRPDSRRSDSDRPPDAEADAEAEEGPVDVPFSPELGRAAVTSFGFAVGALSPASGAEPTSAASGERGQRAVLALLGRDGPGRLVELGRASEPPRVFASGERLIVVSVEAGARARALRIGTLVRALEKPELSWAAGAELPSDPSSVFAVETGAEGVFVVWDERDEDAGRSAIWGRHVALSSAKKKNDPIRLSPEKLDAVVPRLARRRDGGYWLAYLSEEERAVLAPPTADGGAPRANGSGASAVSSDEAPLEPSERSVRQTLMLASLNERGQPEAPPKRLGDSADHALLFDLEVLPDDRALLAVRQESTLPGSDAGEVELFLVAHQLMAQAAATEGSALRRTRVEVEDASPGAPVLLADAEAGRAPAAFLAVLSRDGRTLLSPVQVDRGSEAGVFAAGSLEPRLGYGEPLAVARGRLSIATPRGGAIDLGVVACELVAGG